MTRKPFTPTDLAEAVSLRAAGFTLAAISERQGVSVSTLQRAFRKLKIKKGELHSELVESAKQELLNRITSEQAVLDEAARLVADDLAHARMLRERMAVAAEQLEANDLAQACLLFRAAAAYSTALKNTSDVLRRVMRLDRLDSGTADELPDLVIRELEPQELDALKAERGSKNE